MERIEEATENICLSPPRLPKDTTKESLTDGRDKDIYTSSLDPFEEWDSISNDLVLQLFCHIFVKTLPHVPATMLDSIISKMKVMLMKEFSGLNLPFRITKDHIRVTVKGKTCANRWGVKAGWGQTLLDWQCNPIIHSTMTHLQTSDEKLKKCVQNNICKLFLIMYTILGVTQCKVMRYCNGITFASNVLHFRCNLCNYITAQQYTFLLLTFSMTCFLFYYHCIKVQVHSYLRFISDSALTCCCLC